MGHTSCIHLYTLEGTSRVLDPVVIGQDDQTELHVQAVVQGGRRHLDIRMWRRGPTGFAPSRNALTLEASDLDALLEGIRELLDASNGGKSVARVVWDQDESRRLRAETEPFGTRYLARLGFWQRVRDSWKPAGDGLVLAADQLKPLRALLRDIRPRLEPPIDAEALQATQDAEAEQDGLQPWPAPGADWLTLDGDRISFHPRGIRITGAIEDSDGSHRLRLHQWKRQDTLWLPTELVLDLTLTDIDAALTTLQRLSGDEAPPAEPEDDQLPFADGSTVWVRLDAAEGRPWLRLDRLPPTSDDDIDTGYERRISMPAEYLSRFGRMLWQTRSLLITRLSDREREELLTVEELEAISAEASAVELPDAEEVVAPSVLDPGIHDAPAPPDDTPPHPPPADPPADRFEPDWQPEEPSDEPERRSVSLGDLTLGRAHLFLFLQEGPERALFLQWEGRSLQLPVDHLEDMLSRVRDLYYDTLRGRRGHAIIIGSRPAVTVSVHHHGSITHLALDQELNGRITHLSFPTNEVPAFLNIAEAALAKI